MATDTHRVRQGSASSMSGTLSGPGTDMLHATVYARPAPGEAPPALMDVVSPRRGPTGLIRHWQIAAGRAVSDAALTEFLRWRADFAIDRFLGERALVSAFIDWADPDHRLPELHALRSAGAQLGTRAVLRLKWDVDDVARRCHASDERGLGVVTALGGHAPSRALLPTSSPTTVLAAGDARIMALGDELAIRVAGEGEAVLRGWSVMSGTVAISTGSGANHMYSADSDAGRIVRMLGRDASWAELRPMPVRTLLAPLLASLHEVADLAGHPDAQLHVSASGG